MRSLEAYISPCHIVEDHFVPSLNEWVIVVKELLPVQLFDQNGKSMQDFWIVQIANPHSLTADDVTVMTKIAWDIFENTDAPQSVPNLIVVDEQNRIHGIIHRLDVESLRAFIQPAQKDSGDRFGIDLLITSPKSPLTIVWVCPVHPQVPPYYAHRAGANIPPCPIGKEPRIAKKEDDIVYTQPSMKSANAPGRPNLLSRIVGIVWKKRAR